jgi:hypothetical protein
MPVAIISRSQVAWPHCLHPEVVAACVVTYHAVVAHLRKGKEEENRIYSSGRGGNDGRSFVALVSLDTLQRKVPMELTITQEEKGAGRTSDSLQELEAGERMPVEPAGAR